MLVRWIREEAVKAQCSRQRCVRRPQANGLCRQHLVADADVAFSKFIRDRDGYCQVQLYYPEILCLGVLQCMHLVPRGYFALRWDAENAAAGCAAHHTYLTLHPIEHYEFASKYLTPKGWEALRDRRFGAPMRPEDYLEKVTA